MIDRRVLAVVLGAVLAVCGLSASALAAGEVNLTATVSNTDGVPQNGTICLEAVGSGSCGGNSLVNGAWSAVRAPGDYVIQVQSTTMDGHVRWYQEGNGAGTVTKAEATQVHPTAGGPDFHFDMVIPAIAKVTGRVLDNHGAPAVNTTVFRSQSGHTRNTTTDTNGEYDFGYVRSGVHTLTVAAHGENAGTSGSMTVPASGDYVVPDLTVQRAAAIHGQVTDSVSGDPLPLVYIEVYTAGSHQYQGATYTDLDGEYRIPQLGNQPLVARFTDEFGGYQRRLYVSGDPNNFAGEVSFSLAAEEDRLVDVALTPQAIGPAPDYTIAGQVTGPGGVPLPGMVVTSDGLYTETDRAGRWYLDAPPGSHVLRVEPLAKWADNVFGTQPGWFPEFYPDASTAAAATPVSVTSGVVQENLNMALDRGAFIRGTVRDASEDSAGFVPAWQAYRPDGGLDVESSFSGGPSYTAFVRPGTWRLVLRAQRTMSGSPTVFYVPRWFGDIDSFAAASTVTVAAGEVVTGKDVHLTSDFDVVSPPEVTGKKVVGKTLVASPGVWSTMTLTQFATTWWRGSTQVGSGPSYVVKAADAGKSLRARVAATNGSATGTSFSPSAAIAKLAAKVTAAVSSPSAGAVRLAVRVKAGGLKPKGTVAVRRGTKVVKKAKLSHGKVVVTLKGQPKGVQRYTVSYLGSAQVERDSTRSLRVTVR